MAIFFYVSAVVFAVQPLFVAGGLCADVHDQDHNSRPQCATYEDSDNNSDSNEGFDPGSIAGIVITAVILLALLILLLWCWRRHCKRSREPDLETAEVRLAQPCFPAPAYPARSRRSSTATNAANHRSKSLTSVTSPQLKLPKPRPARHHRSLSRPSGEPYLRRSTDVVDTLANRERRASRAEDSSSAPNDSHLPRIDEPEPTLDQGHSQSQGSSMSTKTLDSASHPLNAMILHDAQEETPSPPPAYE